MADAPTKREPLTPEQISDLEEAWAELTKAASDAGVKTISACTRDGSSWQDDLEAVRTVTAAIMAHGSNDSTGR